MNLDQELLDLIVCPACHAQLAVDDAAAELVCSGCGLAYPVRDDIPVLLVDEARQTGPSRGQTGDERA
ncbi:MAG TPA: Trm112 family protein [Marmoricola sp.]|nr:Trm112 family protein [Marmoricola sp.]